MLTTISKSDILSAINTTSLADEGYAQSLRGPRTRGSVTAKGLADLPDNYIAEALADQSAAGKATRIYQGPDGGLGGKLGMMTLAAALDQGKEVKVRLGKHGPELYLNRTLGDEKEAGDWMAPSSVLTFIVATEGYPDVAAGGLITWYPGPVTPNLDPGVAVKLHNG